MPVFNRKSLKYKLNFFKKSPLAIMNVYVYGKYFYVFIISTVIQSVVLAVNGKIILLTGRNFLVTGNIISMTGMQTIHPVTGSISPAT